MNLKTLPIFVFFCCIFKMFGQLSLSNNTYIFATNTVVFVEDNINIQDVNSVFYLRNESQLIQGSGVTGNSGMGDLSIHQTGNADPYTYNYWCSPVGLPSLTNGNDSFQVALIDDSTGLISSNDAIFMSDFNGIDSPLSISNRWLYTFENSDQYSGWVFQGNTGNIGPGLGFSMKGTSGSLNQVYDFRGKPNSGTIQNSVSESLFTLIGNPYPSAVDALQFIHDPQNVASITGVLYLWDQDFGPQSHVLVDYRGGYATYTISSDASVVTFVPATFDSYNGDGTLNTSGSNSTNVKNFGRYIPIGQGFMVEGVAASSGTVYMKNTFRAFEKENITNGSFFKYENKSKQSSQFFQVPNDYKRFRLNIDFNNLYTRQLVQTFHDTKTSNKFDVGYDIPYSYKVSNDAFWSSKNESKDYIAQALPLDTETTELPINFKLSNKQPVRIRLTDVQNFDTSEPIYLYDSLNETYLNLKEQDAEMVLDTNNYESRFSIVFSKQRTLNVQNFENSDFYVYHKSSTQSLNIVNYNTSIKTVKLYDALGRSVFQFNNLNLKSLHALHTPTLPPGTYIVRIEAKDLKIGVKSVKIIVKD